MSPLDITIVGAGVVGTNLAVAFDRLGHRVRFGARDVSSDKVRAALSAVPGSTAVSLTDATDGADLVVLAVPYPAVADTVTALGSVDGTVLVDATNVVGSSLPAGARSIVDVIHGVAPDARIVKAFNTIGAEAYLDPVIDGRAAFLPVAGDEQSAAMVAELGSDMGFDALVVGGPDQADLLEGFARLWIHLAFGVGIGRDFGFARVLRPTS